MFDLDNHKDWVSRAISSCTTMEQLECCRVMISLFVGQMTSLGVDIQKIRLLEDELLVNYLSKDATLRIP